MRQISQRLEPLPSSGAGSCVVGLCVCFEHEDWIRRPPAAPTGGRLQFRAEEARVMQVETGEPQIIERVAALDVGKARRQLQRH